MIPVCLLVKVIDLNARSQGQMNVNTYKFTYWLKCGYFLLIHKVRDFKLRLYMDLGFCFADKSILPWYIQDLVYIQKFYFF